MSVVHFSSPGHSTLALSPENWFDRLDLETKTRKRGLCSSAAIWESIFDASDVKEKLICNQAVNLFEPHFNSLSCLNHNFFFLSLSSFGHKHYLKVMVKLVGMSVSLCCSI